MVWDTLVQFEPLNSKNQKFLKSAYRITLDHNPTIIFNFSFFDEIEESVRGHFCAVWVADFRKPKIFKIGYYYRKINDFLNQTFLSIGSALLFLKSEIEKSGLGHFSAA